MISAADEVGGVRVGREKGGGKMAGWLDGLRSRERGTDRKIVAV